MRKLSHSTLAWLHDPCSWLLSYGTSFILLLRTLNEIIMLRSYSVRCWPPGKCSIHVSCHYYSCSTLIWTGDEDTDIDEDMGVEMGKEEI